MMLVPDLVVVSGGVLTGIDRDADAWLTALAHRLVLADHLVVSDGDDEPEPLLRNRDGGWQVGRYVGELAFLDGRIRIHAPGEDIGEWPVAAPHVARMWCAGVEAATRHGPPAIHTELPHEGASLRGRLDVRRTVRLRAKGSSMVASAYRARDLKNPITSALVAADRSLTRQLHSDRWRTRRVQEVLPSLHEAVGRRAPLPTLHDLGRIRYTPITRPFREVAEMSVRIVGQDPVVTTTERGRPQGVLVPLGSLIG